jgi:hypothetical protein
VDCWNSVFGGDRDFKPPDHNKTSSRANLTFSQIDAGATHCNMKLTTHFHTVSKYNHVGASVLNKEIVGQIFNRVLLCLSLFLAVAQSVLFASGLKAMEFFYHYSTTIP